MRTGISQRVDRPAAPGNDRDASLLSQDFEATCTERRMMSPSGPMKTMPRSLQRSANSACSATKPHPTQTASARTAVKARSSWP